MRIIRIVVLGLYSLAGLLIVVSGISIVFDVLRRNLGMGALRGVVEYNEIGIAIVAFASLSVGQWNNSHVRVEILRPRSDAGQRILLLGEVIGYSVTTIVLIWASWASSLAAIQSVRIGEYHFGLTRVPIWPGRIAASLGLFGLTVAIISHTAGLANSPESAVRSDGDGPGVAGTQL